MCVCVRECSLRLRLLCVCRCLWWTVVGVTGCVHVYGARGCSRQVRTYVESEAGWPAGSMNTNSMCMLPSATLTGRFCSWWFCHCVGLSLGNSVTGWLCHWVVLCLGGSVPGWLCHWVALSLGGFVTWWLSLGGSVSNRRSICPGRWP